MLKKIMLTALLVPTLAMADGFSLSSDDLKANRLIPDKHALKGFGCEGGNVSPALAWKNAPKGTKSFAVTAYDPDAPTGSGWWHWVVFNLPADTTSLPQGAGDPAAGKLPTGAVQGRTDFGAPGWGGPCPPKGDKPHRFIFTVHALKTEKLDVGADISAAMVGFMLKMNTLATAKLLTKSSR